MSSDSRHWHGVKIKGWGECAQGYCYCGDPSGKFHRIETRRLNELREESRRIAPEARELETTGAHDFGAVGRDA